MLQKIGQMEGTQGWISEYGRVEDEGRMALLLGRSVDSVGERREIEEVRKWWKNRQFSFWYLV